METRRSRGADGSPCPLDRCRGGSRLLVACLLAWWLVRSDEEPRSPSLMAEPPAAALDDARARARKPVPAMCDGPATQPFTPERITIDGVDRGRCRDRCCPRRPRRDRRAADQRQGRLRMGPRRHPSRQSARQRAAQHPHLGGRERARQRACSPTSTSATGSSCVATTPGSATRSICRIELPVEEGYPPYYERTGHPGSRSSSAPARRPGTGSGATAPSGSRGSCRRRRPWWRHDQRAEAVPLCGRRACGDQVVRRRPRRGGRLRADRHAGRKGRTRRARDRRRAVDDGRRLSRDRRRAATGRSRVGRDLARHRARRRPAVRRGDRGRHGARPRVPRTARRPGGWRCSGTRSGTGGSSTSRCRASLSPEFGSKVRDRCVRRLLATRVSDAARTPSGTRTGWRLEVRIRADAAPRTSSQRSCVAKQAAARSTRC